MKKTKIVFARMQEKDVRLLHEVCEARGEDLSDFVRRAVKKELGHLSYLSYNEKKALGILENQKPVSISPKPLYKSGGGEKVK